MRRVHATTSRILRWGRSLPREKIRSASNTNPRPTSLRSSRNPSPMAQRPPSQKAKKPEGRRLSITLSRKRALSTLHTASSSIAENTTASSLCTTASQGLCRRSRGPRSKAQEARYPVLIAARLRQWAGILLLPDKGDGSTPEANALIGRLSYDYLESHQRPVSLGYF